MLSPAPVALEFFWDDLLEYIGEKHLTPIVGPELLTVSDRAGVEAPLMRVLAQRLVERLRVAADDCTGDDALHQVVCRQLQRGGRREEVYPGIRTLFKELAPRVPPILRELARIRHFNVFVTTTFDSLLAQALDEERHAGAPRTKSLAYSPNTNTDLPADARRSDTPTVFHLLGRLSASPDYVITEEDTLEFFTAMQSESKRPNVLLDELKASHLFGQSRLGKSSLLQAVAFPLLREADYLPLYLRLDHGIEEARAFPPVGSGACAFADSWARKPMPLRMTRAGKPGPPGTIRYLSFAQAAWRGQVTKWSLTMPVACMKA